MAALKKAAKKPATKTAKPSRETPGSLRATRRAETAHLPPPERSRQSRKARAYQRHARLMYVEEGSYMKDIAAHFEVAERTVLNWKMRDKESGNDWDKARSAYLIGPGGPDSIVHVFVPLFFKLMNDTMKRVQNAKPEEINIADQVSMITRLTDSSVKAANAIGKLQPQLNELSIALKMLDALRKFTAQRFPQHSAAFAEMLEPFGEEVLAQFGNEGR
jgi:hypothetical protein